MCIEYIQLYVVTSIGMFFQITNNNNTSLFTIKANETDAKADNGMYNCQITLFIAEMDNFSSASNYSVVLFEGTVYYVYDYIMYITAVTASMEDT